MTPESQLGFDPVPDQVIDGDILFRQKDHTYWHMPTGQELTPVSRVIQAVYPAKSWDGVDRSVVDNARIRGERVDAYLAHYIRNGRVDTTPGERRDVIQRLKIAIDLLDGTYGAHFMEPQKIVYDLEDGVAGMVDISVDHFYAIVDLKCCYATEPSWKLQIGAYATYSRCSEAKVIHISPSVYKQDGGEVIPYDVEECKLIWHRAILWYRTMQRLTNGEKKEVGCKD